MNCDICNRVTSNFDYISKPLLESMIMTFWTKIFIANSRYAICCSCRQRKSKKHCENKFLMYKACQSITVSNPIRQEEMNSMNMKEISISIINEDRAKITKVCLFAILISSLILTCHICILPMLVLWKENLYL